MAVDISELVQQISGEMTEKAYKASDSLGRIGSPEVVTAMVELLKHPYSESRIMAARSLGLVKNNQEALSALLDAIKSQENRAIAGDLMVALDGFDLEGQYVELFKLYLFGSFKVSMVARDLLDHKEFDITPRVIKKARKHWDHYSNNIKHDEIYELRKVEVESMLNDLKDFLD